MVIDQRDLLHRLKRLERLEGHERHALGESKLNCYLYAHLYGRGRHRFKPGNGDCESASDRESHRYAFDGQSVIVLEIDLDLDERDVLYGYRFLDRRSHEQLDWRLDGGSIADV